MITSVRTGVSSYEIGRSLGVTQKTAWFMMHRIRLALQKGSIDRKLMCDVEADETTSVATLATCTKTSASRPCGLKAVFRKAVVIGMFRAER